MAKPAYTHVWQHLHEKLSTLHWLSESDVSYEVLSVQNSLASPKLVLVHHHTRAASDGSAAIALVQPDGTSFISSNGINMNKPHLQQDRLHESA